MPSSDTTLGVVSSQERRDLYWAMSEWWALAPDANGVIAPRRWVASSPLYAEVEANLTGGGLTELDARRSQYDAAPTLEKCAGEAVFEAVRREVSPTAPSRLNCLFATEDMYGAVEFLRKFAPPLRFDAEGFGSHAALPVSTADGAWVAVDMRRFVLPQVGPDARSNDGALGSVRDAAAGYWRGDVSGAPFVEVLCEKLWRWTAYIATNGAPPAAFTVWMAGRP